MHFKRRIAVSREHLAFHVDRADIVHGNTAALARADVDQRTIVVEPYAAMTVVIDDVGLLEHADAIDQLLFQFTFGHDTSPALTVVVTT